MMQDKGGIIGSSYTTQIQKVGVIGYGYWGKKLARVFNQLGVLASIVDVDRERRKEAKRDYPDIQEITAGTLNLGLDAVAIATPPETHYELASSALESGFHTFVEKPLATKYSEALELEDLAYKNSLKLHVGHIYLHNPGLTAIPRPRVPFELRIRFLNDKGPPSNATKDLLWAAGPHAMSIVCHFLDKPLSCVIQTVKSSNEMWINLNYEHGTVVVIDIGDYAGVRARTVQIAKRDKIWSFDAARPGEYEDWTVRGRAIIDCGTHKVADYEPLLAECAAFVNSPVLLSSFPDLPKESRMGSNVVSLLERVM